MATVYLYRYREYVQLTQADRNAPNVNMPMIIYDTKVYKGVTNPIEFIIRNNDRKPVSMIGYSMVAQVRRVDNPTNAKAPPQVLLEKNLVPIDETAGKYKLILQPEDIEDWDTGYYQYNIRTVDQSGSYELLYTDINKSTSNTFELIEGIASSMSPAIEVPAAKFTPTPVNDALDTIWVTGAMPGDAQSQRASGTHTIAVYTDDWTGKLWVEGSLTNTPPLPQDWFPIKLGTNTDYFEYTPSTKSNLRLVNFTMNLYWLRVSFRDAPQNSGKFLRILYKS